MRDLSDRQLIEIIDRPENIDAEKRKEALDELNARDIPLGVLKEAAVMANESIAYGRILQDPIAEDSVEIHESYFLNTDEMRQVYIDQLEKYMRYKDQFRYDVWAYAIGGIL